MSCSEWKIIKFEESGLEIEDGDRGKNYPKKSELLSQGYCPFLNNKNILDDKINFDEVEFITKQKDELLRKGKIKVGDIVLTTRGSVGNVGLFHENLRFKQARINSGMVIIRNNNEIFDINYLYQLLKSPYMKQQYKSMSTGTAQPQLPIKDIKKLNLIVPPLEEQEKISGILSSLDNKIELNNKMNKTLEEVAQSIFKRWFVDFEFPNEDGLPYKSSGGEMVESELGMIPKGWEVTHIYDISQVTMGVSPSSKTYNEDNIGLPLLNGAADFEGKLIKPSKFTSEPKKICKKGDMVFGVRATIGNIVFADKEYALGRGVASVEPNNKVFREFIYYSLDNSMENLINNASGSVFLNLKKADITDLKVCYSEEIVEKFNNVAKVLIDKVIENDIESEMLKQNRDILLSKLMNGEIQI